MKKRVFVALEIMVSLLVICGLFWVAFFVKPTVVVEEVERFPFERRDAFYAVTALDDQGLLMCVVGSYGKVIRTDDGGASWIIQKTPTRNHLQNVVAWDVREQLAIGDKNTVIVTHDGGSTWVAVDVPSYPFGGQLLGAHVDPDSGRAWVVGSMGTVMVSDDRGASWTMVHPEEDLSWNGVTVAADRTVWLVGEFGAVRRSVDDGQSWEPVAVPTEASLNAIVFADAEHGAIVGLSGTLLVTADGGQSWELVESGTSMHLYDLLWDGQHYRAVGDAGVIVTGDAGGAAWSATKLSPNNFAWYTGIAPMNGRYFVSGAGAGIYGGGKWLPFTPGMKSYEIGGANNG